MVKHHLAVGRVVLRHFNHALHVVSQDRFRGILEGSLNRTRQVPLAVARRWLLLSGQPSAGPVEHLSKNYGIGRLELEGLPVEQQRKPCALFVLTSICAHRLARAIKIL